ncbi:MAG: carboxypeptidase regulatory-like domain-containing protein [Bacteroidaceae bacterium]|nr:carboxypeptidase regulatory-like domain-containing protein [Bacteroidaceae bacterium]
MKRLFVFIQMLIAFVSGVSAQTAPAGYSEVANWTEGFENFASTIKPNPGLGWAYIDGGFVESTWTTMFSKNSSYYATGSYSLGITNTATSAAVNYLVTPAIKGQVKMQARALSYSSSYEGTQYIKFYKVTKNEDGTFSVPTEEDLLATEDLGLNNTFHEIAPLNLSEYTYVAITGSRAYIDDFTADYALMPENPALQVTAISSEWSDNNPLYADATGKFTWTGKFKVKNAGNVDLVAGRDNYSVTVTSQSTSKITIPETIIPISVDLAQGQESEEFELSLECQLVDITAVESRTAFRVTSNLVEYGKTNTNSDYYKQSSWFTAKSSNPSLDVRNANGNKMEDTKFDLGLVAGSGSHTFKVYNVGGSDAVITAIESTIPEGFSHNAALPLTIARGESAEVELTIGGEAGYKEGTVTFTYGDGFTYTTKNISATVIGEGTYLETFGTELTPAKTYVPGGWINQAGSNWEAAASSYNIHMKNTVQQYPTAMLVSPKITFAEGQNLTVGVTSQTTSFYSSTDAYLQVYYSTDRQNWQLANVITYNDTKKSATEDINGNAIDANKIIEWGSLNGTTVDKIKAYTIDGIPAGDYYIGFRSGYALIDYIFGGQLANVENDLYIDEFTVNPGKAMVNYDATASVTYRNMSDKAAAAHTVALYDGETLIEEKAGADLAAYASSTVDFTFTPRAAGEMNLKAVVKNVEGEYSVESEVSTINIVAETFTADALVGTHTKTYDRYTPIRTYDKNSKSEWIWTKEVLGLDDKTAITSVAFPYYNTDKDVTAEHFAFYLVNIDEEKDDFASADAWTDLSELTPAFEATNYTLKKAGTSSDPALLTLSLAEPFVYTGGNVKGIMLIEKQNTYSSYYFEYNSDNNLFSSIYTSSDNYDTYKGANPTRKQQYPVATLSLAVQAPVLSGTITAEEVALEGATVEAKSGNVIYTATTDAEGKYSMEIMQPTLEYVVTVSAEGYESFVSEAMTIAENTTLDTDLQVATPATVTVSINPEIGYATFYDSKHAVKIPEGVTAYVFTQKEDGNLGLVEYAEALSWDALEYDGVIPAGKAVVLKGAGEVVLECASTDLTAEDGASYLLGTDEDEMITENFGGLPCLYYALTLNAENDPESVGFYWMNETGAPFVNKAHKAYLVIPQVNPGIDAYAKKAYLFKGDATAIQNANASANSAVAPMFNIAGQRVNENAKGIVIKNGRKYIIK